MQEPTGSLPPHLLRPVSLPPPGWLWVVEVLKTPNSASNPALSPLCALVSLSVQWEIAHEGDMRQAYGSRVAQTLPYLGGLAPSLVQGLVRTLPGDPGASR